jgi:hypothetical protein
MFCQSCGSTANSTANFCNSCGSSLKDGNNTKELPSNASGIKNNFNTSGASTTMSFEEFLERRAASNQSNDQEQTFKAIQKRKSNERTKSIKKKKDEIVKVCTVIVLYLSCNNINILEVSIARGNSAKGHIKAVYIPLGCKQISTRPKRLDTSKHNTHVKNSVLPRAAMILIIQYIN